MAFFQSGFKNDDDDENPYNHIFVQQSKEAVLAQIEGLSEKDYRWIGDKMKEKEVAASRKAFKELQNEYIQSKNKK